MLDMSKEYIKARDKEKIQVITFMNDDLFYGVANEEVCISLWSIRCNW